MTLKLFEMLASYLDWGLEITILATAFMLAILAEIFMKIFGSFIAYTRFGSNMVVSYVGIIMFKAGGATAMIFFWIFILSFQYLTGVKLPIGTVKIGFPD